MISFQPGNIFATRDRGIVVGMLSWCGATEERYVLAE